MPFARTTIPRDIKEFDNYINSTNLYILLSTLTGNPAVLVVNWTRYNWSALNLSDWQAFLAAWKPLHDKYMDKKGGYTTNVKNDLLIIIANVVKYAHENKLIELVKATRVLTSADCSAWRLPEDLAAPTGGHLPGTHPTNIQSASADRTVPTEIGRAHV